MSNIVASIKHGVSEMKTRKTGYYWVKFHDRWRVEFFSNSEKGWIISETIYNDEDLEKINETRIKNPDEELRK